MNKPTDMRPRSTDPEDGDINELLNSQGMSPPAELDDNILIAARWAVNEQQSTDTSSTPIVGDSHLPATHRGNHNKYRWMSVAATVVLAVSVAPLLLKSPESEINSTQSVPISTTATQDVTQDVVHDTVQDANRGAVQVKIQTSTQESPPDSSHDSSLESSPALSWGSSLDSSSESSQGSTPDSPESAMQEAQSKQKQPRLRNNEQRRRAADAVEESASPAAMPEQPLFYQLNNVDRSPATKEKQGGTQATSAGAPAGVINAEANALPTSDLAHDNANNGPDNNTGGNAGDNTIETGSTNAQPINIAPTLHNNIINNAVNNSQAGESVPTLREPAVPQSIPIRDDPGRWLADIKQLMLQGYRRQAELEFKAFRLAYPDIEPDFSLDSLNK